MKKNASSYKNALSKWIRIGLYILGILVLFVIGTWIGGWYLQEKMPEKLKSIVHEKTQGQYALDFDKMRVRLIAGNLKLKNLSLNPDTNVYGKGPDSAKVLYRLAATELTLTGLDVIEYLLHKNLQIKGIKLINPDLTIIKMHDIVEKDTVKKDLYQQLPAELKGTELAFIDVQNLSFSQREIGHMHQRVNRLEGLTFRLNDILLDSTALQDSARSWFCKDIVIDSKDLKYRLGNGLYVLSLKNILASSRAGSMTIEDFRVIPQYPELEFSKRLGTEGDRYDISVPLITLNEIDFKALAAEGKLIAKALVLSDGQVRIFNNKTLPETGKNKIRNAPHLALQRMAFPISMDTVQLKNFEVHYREKSPVSNSTGDVFFTNLNGILPHVTNDSLVLLDHTWCRSHFDMHFLGKVKVQVDLNLNLASKNGEFNYQGSMSPSSVTAFNSLLQPLAMVKATEGYIRKLAFDVKANQQGSSGTVQFLYSDLKVDLLIRENSGKIGTRGLVSFLANEMVILSNNPEPEQPVRIARFSHTHPATRSFFNLMWKSIFTGLKETILADQEAAKESKKLAKEKRKEERKEKRRERRLEKSNP